MGHDAPMMDGSPIATAIVGSMGDPEGSLHLEALLDRPLYRRTIGDMDRPEALNASSVRPVGAPRTGDRGRSYRG